MNEKNKSLLTKIGAIVTIAASVVAMVISIFSFIRELKDPRLEASYNETSGNIKQMSMDIRENRIKINTLTQQLRCVPEVEPPASAEDVEPPTPSEGRRSSRPSATSKAKMRSSPKHPRIEALPPLREQRPLRELDASQLKGK